MSYNTEIMIERVHLRREEDDKTHSARYCTPHPTVRTATQLGAAAGPRCNRI